MAIVVPYPNMDFTPLDVLTATEMDQIVANYEYIANEAIDILKYRRRTYSPYGGTAIPANANINSAAYTKVGKYYCTSWADAQTMTNLPEKNAFIMEVISPISTTIDNESSTWVYRLRYFTNNVGTTYVQRANTDGTAGHWVYGPWYRIDNTNQPEWSTIVVPNGADQTGTFTSNRGNSYTYSRTNGAAVKIMTGAESVRTFKQTMFARLSSNVTKSIWFTNAKPDTTAYTYWTGSNGLIYDNKNENHATSSGRVYGTLIDTNSTKGAISVVMTGTRTREDDNTWTIHAEVQCSGSNLALTLHTEITANNAGCIPTFFLDGETATNTAYGRNVIEILEEA